MTAVICVAIKLADRYFIEFDRAGKVQTAAHISGARLFPVGRFTPPHMDQICDKLALKGKQFTLVRIVESDENLSHLAAGYGKFRSSDTGTLCQIDTDQGVQ